MKQMTIKALISGMALVLGLASCSKQEDMPNISVEGDLWTITGSYPGGVQGFPTQWSDGDSFCLYVVEGSSLSQTVCTNDSGEGKNATFSVNNCFSTGTARTFYAAAPVKSTENGTGVEAASMEHASCLFDLSQVQEQSETMSLRNYLLLWADPISEASMKEKPEQLDFIFRHLCSALGFSIKSVPGVSVTGVEVMDVDAEGQPLPDAEGCFGTKLSVNRASGGDVMMVGPDGYVSSMRLDIPDGGQSGDFTAKIAVLPVNLTGHTLKVKIYTLRNGEEAESCTVACTNTSKTWASGRYYTQDIDLNGLVEPGVPDAEQITPALTASCPAFAEAGVSGWTTGDKLWFYAFDGTTTHSSDYTAAAGGASAAFSTSSSFSINSDYTEGRTFFAAAPAKATGNVSGVDDSSFSGGACTFDLAATQSYEAGVGKYLLLWGTPVPDAEDLDRSDIPFTFNQLCAVLGLEITNLPVGVRVKKVEVKDLDGTCFATKLAMPANTTSGAVNSMNVSMTTLAPATGTTLTAMLSVLPQVATHALSIVVSTNDGVADDTYTFNGISATAWAAGSYYSIPLNFTDKKSDSFAVKSFAATYPAFASAGATAWASGDALYFYADADKTANSNNGTSLSSTTNQLSNSAFSTGSTFNFAAGFTLDLAVNANRMFYAAGPVKAAGNGNSGVDAASMANTNGVCNFDLTSTQIHQTGAGKYLLLWGTPIADGTNVAESLSFTMTQLCAVLGFTINGQDGVTVNSVEVTDLDAAAPTSGFATKLAVSRTGATTTPSACVAAMTLTMNPVLVTTTAGTPITANLVVLPSSATTHNLKVVVKVTKNSVADTYTFVNADLGTLVSTAWGAGSNPTATLNLTGKSDTEKLSVNPVITAVYPALTGVTTDWSASSTLSFYTDDGNNTVTPYTYTYDAVNGGKFFNASCYVIDNLAWTFYAATPAAAVAATVAGTTFTFDMPATQDGNVSQYLRVWGGPVSVAADADKENLSFTLQQLSAVLGFVVTDVPAEVTGISSITLQEVDASNKPLSGSTCFATQVTMDAAGTPSVSEFTGAVTVNVTATTDFTAKASVIPGDATKTLNLAVVISATSDAGTGTFTIPLPATPTNWAPGSYTAIPLSLNGLTLELPPPPAKNGELPTLTDGGTV